MYEDKSHKTCPGHISPYNNNNNKAIFLYLFETINNNYIKKCVALRPYLFMQ